MERGVASLGWCASSAATSVPAASPSWPSSRSGPWRFSAVSVWREAHHDDASDLERVDAIVVLGRGPVRRDAVAGVRRAPRPRRPCSTSRDRAGVVFVLGANQPGRSLDRGGGRPRLPDRAGSADGVGRRGSRRAHVVHELARGGRSRDATGRDGRRVPRVRPVAQRAHPAYGRGPGHRGPCVGDVDLGRPHRGSPPAQGTFARRSPTCTTSSTGH